VNRTDFQRLAPLRLKEAKTLHAAGLHAGAYYLAGYSVEFALKSCIAKRFVAGDWPDKKLVDRVWKHDLDDLLEVAELRKDLESARATRPNLDVHWAIVKDWREAERYDDSTTDVDAAALIKAIEDSADGILPWLQQRW
jgi:hypothetical protein